MRPDGHVAQGPVEGPAQVGRAMQIGAGHRAAQVPNARWRRWQWRPERRKERNYKHGRYTAEVAATRR